MPCFSTITKSSIRDLDMLKQSLKELGYHLYTERDNYIEGRGPLGFIGYYLQADGTWSAGTFDRGEAASLIGKTYAKNIVKQFAKSRGYRYEEEAEKNQITLTMGRRY